MALLSKVQIGNMALSNLGEASAVESFEESSPQARQLRVWYDVARVSTLEAFNWNFARKRAVLALHGDDAPEDEWAYRYQYPADCIMARWIVNPAGYAEDLIPYSVEQSEDGFNKTIVTDLEDAELVYTKDVENTTLFSMYFCETLALLLGSKMAIAITGKKSLKDSLLQDWQLAMQMAPSYNANEEIPRKPREAEWIRGRL